MRITGGRLGGRNLVAPKDMRVRPTSDKVRQAIFNILEHNVMDAGIEGLRVLDLFAGTGALGLEALSHGASYCNFVDDAAESRALIHRNVEALGLTGACKIWRRDATALGTCATEGFALAFLDPPYRKDLVPRALASLRDGRWLTGEAIAVVETAEDEAIPGIQGFERIDARDYGDTRVIFYRFVA